MGTLPSDRPQKGDEDRRRTGGAEGAWEQSGSDKRTMVIILRHVANELTPSPSCDNYVPDAITAQSEGGQKRLLWFKTDDQPTYNTHTVHSSKRSRRSLSCVTATPHISKQETRNQTHATAQKFHPTRNQTLPE